MNKNKVIFILAGIIVFFSLLDLFHPGLPLTHDGQDHVARIANFYKNLQEGIFIPRWASNLNWGYGHPILMFLYPMSSYLASFFHFLGFSFVDSTKGVFGFAFVASGITMYMWLKSFLSKESALCGAILYMFAPYRFIDLYVRGAIGEHMAFLFPPLVAYFLFRLSKRINKVDIILGSLSVTGLILAHNAISLMFFPPLFLYSLFLFSHQKKKNQFLFHVFTILILGFGLSAFFWLPAFAEGKYTLRDIVVKNTYANSFVNPVSFLYGVWSYGGTGEFSVQVGIAHWVSVIVGIFLLLTKKKKNKFWILIFFSLVIFIVTLFLMTSYSLAIWSVVTLIQKFQFPWRFLSIIVFITAFIGALVVESLNKGVRFWFIIILLGLISVSNDYWKANEYLLRPESFYTDIYRGTTDTGESAPIWSVRFMERQPKDTIEVISGSAEIIKNKRSSIMHSYTINSKEKARIRENTLYFPGWHVLVDGKETEIQFQDPANRGLITFFVEEGKHTVNIIFKETKLRFLADLVSLLSLVIIIVFLLPFNKLLASFFKLKW